MFRPEGFPVKFHGVLLCLSFCMACVTAPKVNTTPSADQAQAYEDMTTADLLGKDKPTVDGVTEPQRPSEVDPEVPVDPPPVVNPTTQKWLQIAQVSTPEEFNERLKEGDEDEILSLVDLSLPEPAKSLLQYRQALIRHQRGLPPGPVPTQAPTPEFEILHQQVLNLQLPPSTRRICLLLPLDKGGMGTSLHENFLLGLGEEYDDWEIDLRSSENPEVAMDGFAAAGCPLVMTGPYLSRIERAAQRAASLGLPMLSMGRDETLPAQSPWIFQVGLPNRHQIRALVDGAMKLRGYKKFAVLFPRSRDGWQSAEVFTEQVDSAGAEVVYLQPYEKGERTFTTLVQLMVGRDESSLNSRSEFRKCVGEIPKTARGLRRKRAWERCRDHTPPAIDFDAIFIPDDLKTVRQLMAFLEQSDMVASLDPRALWKTRKATSNKELQPTPILGLRQLNSNHLAKRTRFAVDGTLFVDAFYPQGKDQELAAQYARAHYKRYKRKPGLLEATAFDLGRLVADLLQKTESLDRYELRQTLTTLTGFAAMTGPWSMEPDGQVSRPLKLLSIHRRHILLEEERLVELEKAKNKKRRRGR